MTTLAAVTGRHRSPVQEGNRIFIEPASRPTLAEASASKGAPLGLPEMDPKADGLFWNLLSLMRVGIH